MLPTISSVQFPFGREAEPSPYSFFDLEPSRESIHWRFRMKNQTTSFLNHVSSNRSTQPNLLAPDYDSNNEYRLTLSDSRVANSNCAQVLIELRDLTYDEFQLQPYKNVDSYILCDYFDSINSVVINTSSRMKCRKSNIIEVIIRSRFINNYNIFIKDPDLTAVHRNLQYKLSFSSSSARDQHLSARINNYLDILRTIISSANQTPRNVVLFMNVLVAKSLIIDKTFETPITIVNRMQNCKICCLKYFYINYRSWLIIM